ncbi:MAG: DUF4917 family protein [Bacteroidetes bacterium]|nr:DUF4917 family protein [Bacteroidota bacterium]
MRTVGDIKIYHWSEIQDSFREADIFLGNGFSININNALNYRSLFDRFLTYLDSADQLMFKRFNTTNFEGIQTELSNAIEVNRIFGQDVNKQEAAIKNLKHGLIGAVRDLHPSYSQIDPNTIFQISQKLDWFGNIYTTNYDTFLYHITLATLDRAKRNNSVKKNQDFFRNECGRLTFKEGVLSGLRCIYYLHGALFIRTEANEIIKISRGSRTQELLELIKLQVHLGYLPVFVSEGTTERKTETISKNRYLSYCFEALKASFKDFVIYGFSFSKCDDHISEQFNNCRRRLAISIYTKGLNESQIQKYVKGVEERLYRNRSTDLKFYDSSTLF